MKIISIQDAYQPPGLEWYQILRGSEEGGYYNLGLFHTFPIHLALGELLAAFEMFELGGEFEKLPELPNVKEVISADFGPSLPVPPHIRPSLVKYRYYKYLVLYCL